MKKNEHFKEESDLVREFDRKGIILSTQNGKMNYHSLRAPLSPSDKDTLVASKEKLISYLEYLVHRCRSYMDRYKTSDGETLATFQQDGYRKFYAGGNLSKIKPNIFSRILSVKSISKEVDENILRKAVNELSGRAETLRSDLFVDGDRTFQTVNERREIELINFDVDNFESDDEILDKIISDISKRGVYPLFNAAILSGRNGSRCLVILVSHLVFDLWSKNILEKRLEEIYGDLIGEDGVIGQGPEIQYNDYAEEQKNFDIVFRDMKYWSHNLSGARTPALPMSHQDNSPGTFSYADSFLGQKEVLRLTDISRMQGTTLSVGMLGVFAAALRIWSGDDDLIINTTYNGRNHEKYYDIMGLFAGRVPVRLGIRDDHNIPEIISEVREVQTSAWSYSIMPTQGISEILELPSGVNKIVFNSSIEMGGGGPGETGGPDLFLGEEDSDASHLRQAIQAAHFRAERMEPTDIELIFYLGRHLDGISIKVGYSDRFAASDIEKLLQIVKRVVGSVASTEGVTISELLNS